jgi:hypothetical protein
VNQPVSDADMTCRSMVLQTDGHVDMAHGSDVALTMLNLVVLQCVNPRVKSTLLAGLSMHC